jgi:hypothetical protein
LIGMLELRRRKDNHWLVVQNLDVRILLSILRQIEQNVLIY